MELDPQAYNLARAIRRTETEGSKDPYNAKGASGEFGGYQFMPATYKSLAKKHLGDENAPPTIENQNKLAYSEIKELKDKGMTPAQIASVWNSGRADAYKQQLKGTNAQGVKYDVPDYVAKVSKAYEELKSETEKAPPKPVEIKDPNAYDPNDSGLQAGFKALKNTPESALNFAKGALQTINPINTAKTLGEVGTGFSELQQQRGTMGAIGDVVRGLPKAAYETLVPQGVRSILSGDLEGAAKSFTEDPFGQTAPIVLTALGGAKVADNIATKRGMANYVEQPYTQKTIPKPTTKFSDMADTAITNIAKPVVKPIGTIAAPFGNLAKKTTESATSQLLGKDPKTIETIIANPTEFSKLKIDQATRGNLASEFGRAVEKVEETLQETGSAYESIRKQNTSIPVPEKFIDSVLDSFGLKIKKGKVTADTTSATRKPADINSLQEFVSNWGKKKNLTPQEFLNMRSDLADLAKYDKLTGTGKTQKSQVISDKLRQKANELIRPKIKGLKELDEEFAPQKKQFDQIKKDFLQKDANGEYVFKDGAVNKIANATNKGKDALLARMEEVLPGVTKKIEILNAIEDIQKELKVGTYTRGVVGGVALTGNLPAIIAAIISNPSIAVPLLRSLGYTAQKVGPIVETLKMIAGDVNDLRLPMLGVNSIEANRTKAKNNPVSNSI